MRSTRRQRRKTRRRRGGSKIYRSSGRLENLNNTFEGRNFFRKETSNPAELAVGRLIQKSPHPNIVKVYRVTNSYIDIEEVKPFGTEGGPDYDKKTLIAAMEKAKDHLQSLGVMYIDWKPDNVGLAEDGTYRLFDFDVSGVTKPNKTDWNIRPSPYWSYRQATASGMKDPIDIDNFAFDIGIVRENYTAVDTD